MPTNPQVRAAMSETGGLGIDPNVQSTLFDAWIGFNLSHSLGVVVMAAVIAWHGLTDLAKVSTQAWFLVLVVVVPALYLVLAVRFWFAKPRDAIAFASVLVWVGIAVELV